MAKLLDAVLMAFVFIAGCVVIALALTWVARNPLPKDTIVEIPGPTPTFYRVPN